MKGNKYQYQLVVVLNPKTEEKEKVLAKVTDWLEKNKIESVSDHTGLKELAYEINENTKGDFWVYSLNSESPIKLKEFNLLLNRESNIIRYLILKKE
ncbi:MAG: 30S ribosomal protein S6 [Candidatus Shapirobacteria bacterium]|nr:30S ribosomal protein S6 [Candidatus Shapirobacteria bacterium]